MSKYPMRPIELRPDLIGRFALSQCIIHEGSVRSVELTLQSSGPVDLDALHAVLVADVRQSRDNAAQVVIERSW